MTRTIYLVLWYDTDGTSQIEAAYTDKGAAEFRVAVEKAGSKSAYTAEGWTIAQVELFGSDSPEISQIPE